MPVNAFYQSGIENRDMWKRSVAIALLLANAPVLGDAAARPIRAPVDVKLVQGALCGQVFTEAGHSVEGEKIQLCSASGELLQIAQTKTDGEFTFRHLRPGVYRLSIANSHLLIRAWEGNTAPPVAGDSVLLAVGQRARGNGDFPSIRGLRGAGGVGVAIVGVTIGTVVVLSTANASGS